MHCLMYHSKFHFYQDNQINTECEKQQKHQYLKFLNKLTLH